MDTQFLNPVDFESQRLTNDSTICVVTAILVQQPVFGNRGEIRRNFRDVCVQVKHSSPRRISSSARCSFRFISWLLCSTRPRPRAHSWFTPGGNTSLRASCSSDSSWTSSNCRPITFGSFSSPSNGVADGVVHVSCDAVDSVR